MVSLTYWSTALAISARFTPLRNFMLRTRGWCLSHQLSALSPASLVQWIRDCWPAPIPMTWREKKKQKTNKPQGEHRWLIQSCSLTVLCPPVRLWRSRQSWTECTWQRWWPQWGHELLLQRAVDNAGQHKKIQIIYFFFFFYTNSINNFFVDSLSLWKRHCWRIPCL